MAAAITNLCGDRGGCDDLDAHVGCLEFPREVNEQLCHRNSSLIEAALAPYGTELHVDLSRESQISDTRAFEVIASSIAA